MFLQRADEIGHELHRHDDFVRTGARTTCSASASLISLSDSGITSQNVSVKSNGVCAIEQKFA